MGSKSIHTAGLGAWLLLCLIAISGFTFGGGFSESGSELPSLTNKTMVIGRVAKVDPIETREGTYWALVQIVKQVSVLGQSPDTLIGCTPNVVFDSKTGVQYNSQLGLPWLLEGDRVLVASYIWNGNNRSDKRFGLPVFFYARYLAEGGSTSTGQLLESDCSGRVPPARGPETLAECVQVIRAGRCTSEQRLEQILEEVATRTAASGKK